MSRSFSLSLIALLALLAAPRGQAQILHKVGELPIAWQESVRGVSFAYPDAYVSRFRGGVQYRVDLVDPAQPALLTSFNPSGGDVWNENLLYQGRLITGHRAGQLNLWDVSGVPAELDSQFTNYHFAGLAVLEMAGTPFLFYSEHDAYKKPGGLRIYDISADTLVQVGAVLDRRLDGRSLVVTADGWVYQFDEGVGRNNGPVRLNIYDASTPSAPAFCQSFDLGNQPGNGAFLGDLALDPTGSWLYAACGLDGLRILDVTSRCAPVVVTTRKAPGVRVRELSWLAGTSYLAVSASFDNGQRRFRVVDCSNPTQPAAVGSWFGDPDFVIQDLLFIQHPLGPALLVVGDARNGAGSATLQIWM